MAMSSNISSCILPSSQRCGCILPSSQKRCSPLLRSVELHSKPRSQLSMTPPFSVRTLGLFETFSNLKEKGKVAFIPYITAGDPDLRTTIKALKLLDSCGSDIIELGMPYSDPFVDGPVIQVIPQLSCPIVLFSYFNPIYKRGITKFMSTISNAGVHGLVVPDIPLEETRILRSEARKHNIEMVLLTTPITPTERMKAITKASEGFVYLVRSAGVTGNHAPVSSNVQSLLQEIKEVTNKPVAVGFGISKPEHVNQLSGWGADGVIVGSAMVKILGEAKSSDEGLKKLETFARALKTALP